MTADDRPLVAVLDYGIGNLRSAQKGFEKVGADAHLTADRGLIDDAVAVILPGVGAFGRCMEALRESGLDDVALDVIGAGRPFLGICVGMQLLYEKSEEAPGVSGLGALEGTVRLLPDGVKRPQMQWNVVDLDEPCPLFDGIDEPRWMYFVHSYAPDDPSNQVATCDYGGPICCVVHRENLWATQFHPEKSGSDGLAVLGNFLTLATS